MKRRGPCRFQLNLSMSDEDVGACLACLAAARGASISAVASELLLLENVGHDAALLRERMHGLEDAVGDPLDARVEELARLRGRMEDAEEALTDELHELKKLVKRANNNGTVPDEGARETVRRCRRELQALQRKQRELQTKMVHLRVQHFPEIRVLFPKCLPSKFLTLDLDPAVLALLAVGRTFESYSEPQQISFADLDRLDGNISRHAVWTAWFEGKVRLPAAACL